MRAVFSAVVAVSLVTVSTLPLTQALAAAPPAPTADVRAGADVRGEALSQNQILIGVGVVALIILLLLLLDDDDEEEPISP